MISLSRKQKHKHVALFRGGKHVTFYAIKVMEASDRESSSMQFCGEAQRVYLLLLTRKGVMFGERLHS